MHLSVSDDVLVFTTLLLGIVAIFGPAYADKFKVWLTAPKLKVVVHNGPPACHRTEMAFAALSSVGREPAFVYRIQVLNTEGAQAQKAEVVLEALSIADGSGAYQAYPRFTPVQLQWGSGQGDFVDINPGRQFYCDLLTVPSPRLQSLQAQVGAYVNHPVSPTFPLGAVLSVRTAFYSQPNRLGPGKYRLELAVYSENAETVRSSVFVAWSGAWKNAEDEMLKECVLSSLAT